MMKGWKGITEAGGPPARAPSTAFRASFLALWLRLCWAVPVLAQAPTVSRASPSVPAEAIDSIVAEWLALRHAPGVAIGVVQGDAAVYMRGFGVRDLRDPGDSVTPGTMFHVASNSKPFVAALALRLADQGRLDLDAAVTGYLPAFRMRDPRYRDITIRQILSHTSGMPDEEEYGWGDYHHVDDDALLRYVATMEEEVLLSPPGTQFSYSNMAFELMGAVIAEVTGETFEDAVKHALLDDLDMVRSDFLLARVPESLRAAPHVWDVGPAASDTVPYTREHAPSSTLWSSAEEMCHWLIMQLDAGRYGAVQVLSRAGHDAAWASVARTGFGGYDDEYGLGWFTGTYRGRPIVSHKGRDWGFGSMVAILPEDRVGVVVLGNASFAPISQITEAVLDLMLGLEPARPMVPVRYAIGPALLAGDTAAALGLYRSLHRASDPRYAFGVDELLSPGAGLLRHERWADAVAVLQLAVEEFPDVAAAHAALGQAYAGAGRLSLARASLERALALDPANPRIQALLTRLRESGV